MQIAVIQNGKVQNVIEGNSPVEMAPFFPGLTLLNAQGAGIGWDWDGASFTPPPHTPEAIEKALVDAVQAHLDATARLRNYDGILSLASYAASAHATFRTEGLAGVAWRDAVWAHCYTVLADVQAGSRPIPAPEALVAELPPMTWGA